MEMTDRQALRDRFLNDLRETFGEEFLQSLNAPPGAQVGERVLYKLAGGTQAVRREPSAQELDALKQKMVDLAKRTGARGVTFDPPVSSGSPSPRLIDLPGASIMWDTELKKYLECDDLLPAPGFALEWVVGVALLPSEKMLLYLDFTHPAVKVIFRASFDLDDTPSITERTAIRDRFSQFHDSIRELKAQADRRSDLLWVKVVQVDSEPQVVKSKTA